MLREETAVDAFVQHVLTWMLDESDDIEGTRLNLGDERPAFWMHTTDQVREWLKDRLPAALKSATPPGPEQVPASEVGAGDGEGSS